MQYAQQLTYAIDPKSGEEVRALQVLYRTSGRGKWTSFVVMRKKHVTPGLLLQIVQAHVTKKSLRSIRDKK